MKHIKAFFCRLFPRYKLRCILRALNLNPWKWQKDYALGRSNALPHGRATGKTIAVMLRALMQDPSVENLRSIVVADPDYVCDNYDRCFFYFKQYQYYQKICSEAGIPVPKVRYRYSADCWRTT